MAALTSQVTQLLDAAGRIPVTGLAGPEVDSVLGDMFTVMSRMAMHLTAVVEQAEAVDRPAELAAPSLNAWLRGRFGLTPQDAARLVRDMKALRAAPVAADAALLGAIPIQSAAAIGHAITDLPDEVGPELRAEGEDVLLGYALGRDHEQLHARELTLVGRHLHEVLDPDAADRLLAERLAREDAITWRRRYLSITPDGNGGIRLRGLLTAEAGATLRAVLDPLTAPRPATPADTDEPAADPIPDDRTGGQRYADALVEVAERALAHGQLPDTAGQRPTLVITLDHDQLAAGLGAGTLPDGNQLSPAAVRPLACDAGIIPAVLGSTGQILDLGRTARTATPAQRRALAIRDGGCGLFNVNGPSCDRPPGWTDAHPKTAPDPNSSHPAGSTPTSNPDETTNTTSATYSTHHRIDPSSRLDRTDPAGERCSTLPTWRFLGTLRPRWHSGRRSSSVIRCGCRRFSSQTCRCSRRGGRTRSGSRCSSSPSGRDRRAAQLRCSGAGAATTGTAQPVSASRRGRPASSSATSRCSGRASRCGRRPSRSSSDRTTSGTGSEPTPCGPWSATDFS
jgi:hypothetical protein